MSLTQQDFANAVSRGLTEDGRPDLPLAVAIGMELHWMHEDAIAELNKAHDARVTELLTHTTELTERARAAEREALVAENAMLTTVRLAGDLAKMLAEKRRG